MTESMEILGHLAYILLVTGTSQSVFLAALAAYANPLKNTIKLSSKKGSKAMHCNFDDQNHKSSSGT